MENICTIQVSKPVSISCDVGLQWEKKKHRFNLRPVYFLTYNMLPYHLRFDNYTDLQNSKLRSNAPPKQ